MKARFVAVLLVFVVGAVVIAPAQTVTCTETGFFRDGINLTAAKINPATLSGELNATGCNIGVYVDGNNEVQINNADIHGANYFGVLVNGTATSPSAEIKNSHIHDIGENPLNGSQHGIAVHYFAAPSADGSTPGSASGIVSGNTIEKYQKGGLVLKGAGVNVAVADNIVKGEGPINYIAQNGIQISSGAQAIVSGNTVSGHYYTPATWTACGVLYYDAGGVKAMRNAVLDDNQTKFCNAGKGGGKVLPTE